jgi:hypothetical protein
MTLRRKEDHLVGFVAAQPVAVTGIGRDVSGPHCRIESIDQKAVLVRGRSWQNQSSCSPP